MKGNLILSGVLALTTMFAHGGPVSAGDSKNAKAVLPLTPEASWGGPIIGGSIKANSDYVDGSVFLVAPLLNSVGTGSTMEGSVLFVEPYVTWGTEGEAGASLGVGFRHLFSQQSVSDARSGGIAGLLTEGFYVGGNAFFDYGHSQAGNDFWQIGVGLEAGTRYVSVRANGYFPLSDDKTISTRTETSVRHSKHTSSHLSAGPVQVVNGQFVQNFTKTTTTTFKTTTTTTTFELFEEPLEGWDIELVLLVPGLDKYCDVQLIGGYFNYQADRSHRDFEGWRAGVEVRPVPAVVLFGTWYGDEPLYHDDWIAGVRFEIPLGKGWKDAFTPRRRHLAERLYEPVHRKNSTVTNSEQEKEKKNEETKNETHSDTNQSNTQQNYGPVPDTTPNPPQET